MAATSLPGFNAVTGQSGPIIAGKSNAMTVTLRINRAQPSVPAGVYLRIYCERVGQPIGEIHLPPTTKPITYTSPNMDQGKVVIKFKWTPSAPGNWKLTTMDDDGVIHGIDSKKVVSG